jgi:large subunit ribosomal protein L18e
MPKRGTTNPELAKLVMVLRKTKKAVYKKIADELEKPARQRAAVNLWKIDKYSKEGDIIVVPGKVLGEGELTHNVTVAAFQISKKALENKKAKFLSIEKLIQTNPDGKNIKILR